VASFAWWLLVVAMSAACGTDGNGASSSPSDGQTDSMTQLRESTRLQAIVPVGGAPDAPDWQAQGFGSVWVANSAKKAIQRIDPRTNEVTDIVPIGAQPCDGLAAGFGSVWAVDCRRGALVRIDARTSRVTARIAVRPAFDEGLIAAGEGGVWIVRDRPADSGQLGGLLHQRPLTAASALGSAEEVDHASASSTLARSGRTTAHARERCLHLDPVSADGPRNGGFQRPSRHTGRR
jgi:streptogramin lyase